MRFHYLSRLILNSMEGMLEYDSQNSERKEEVEECEKEVLANDRQLHVSQRDHALVM